MSSCKLNKLFIFVKIVLKVEEKFNILAFSFNVVSRAVKKRVNNSNVVTYNLAIKTVDSRLPGAFKAMVLMILSGTTTLISKVLYRKIGMLPY